MQNWNFNPTTSHHFATVQFGDRFLIQPSQKERIPPTDNTMEAYPTEAC